MAIDQVALRRSAAIALAKLGNTDAPRNACPTFQQWRSRNSLCRLPGLVTGDLDRGVEIATELFAVDPGVTDPIPLVQAILKIEGEARYLPKRCAT